MSVLSVYVPPGIGDSLWSITKVVAAKEKLGFHKINIVIQNTDLNRSKEFMSRFTFIDSVSYEQYLIHPPNQCIDTDFTYKYVDSKQIDTDKYMMIANGHLEKGLRLEDWLPEFDIDFDIADKFQFKKSDIQFVLNLMSQIDKPYCVFYIGPLNGNTIDGHNRNSLWTLKNWTDLGNLIHNELKLDIVVVGAPYDKSYSDMFFMQLNESERKYFYDYVGQTGVGDVYAVTKASKFVISYQSGIGIFSAYMGVPSTVFWRPHGNSISPSLHITFNEDMATAWAPPHMLKSNKYIKSIYTKVTPESLLRDIIKFNWLDKAPARNVNNYVTLCQNIHKLYPLILNTYAADCPYNNTELVKRMLYDGDIDQLIKIKALKKYNLPDDVFVNYSTELMRHKSFTPEYAVRHHGREILINVVNDLCDIIWVYQKLSPLFKKISFNILITQPTDKSDRTKEFIMLLPKVISVNYISSSVERCDNITKNKFLTRDVIEQYNNKFVSEFDFSMKGHLTEGVRIDEMSPYDVDLQPKAYYCPVPYYEYIAFNVSDLNKFPSGWNCEHFEHLFNLLYKRFNVNYPVILFGNTGSQQLLATIDSLLKKNSTRTQIYINANTGNVNYIIKHAIFYIGSFSEYSIIADLYDVPQIAMYFSQQKLLMNTWAKKKNIENKTYNAYSFVDSPHHITQNITSAPGTFPYSINAHEDKIGLITGSLTEFIATTSFMTDVQRKNMSVIHFATPNRYVIWELIKKTNVFPCLKQANIIYNDALQYNLFTNQQVRNLVNDKTIKLNCDMTKMVDLNVSSYVQPYAKGEVVYNGLDCIFKTKLSDNISILNLPPKYYVIHPYSLLNKKDYRSINKDEWNNIIKLLEKKGTMGCVLNIGVDMPPECTLLRNFTNGISVLDSIEILKGSCGYIGCDSYLSVLATKFLNENDIFIKSSKDVFNSIESPLYYYPFTVNSKAFRSNLLL